MVRSFLNFLPIILLTACLLACSGQGGVGGDSMGGLDGLDGVGGNPAAPTLGDMGSDVEDTTVVHCEDGADENGNCKDTSYKHTIQNPGGGDDPDPNTPTGPNDFKMNALPPGDDSDQEAQAIGLPDDNEAAPSQDLNEEDFEAQFAF